MYKNYFSFFEYFRLQMYRLFSNHQTNCYFFQQKLVLHKQRCDQIDDCRQQSADRNG